MAGDAHALARLEALARDTVSAQTVDVAQHLNAPELFFVLLFLVLVGDSECHRRVWVAPGHTDDLAFDHLGVFRELGV